MNDIVEQHEHLPAAPAPQPSPFARLPSLGGGAANIGAIMIEQERAIAEAQGKMTLAKRFPRSMANARAEFMDACSDPEFAAAAFYTVKNRGSGPSIRFAEEVARCYQNFDYGHRELSRSEGKSEVEVYAWDMERNNFSRRQITVEHVLDTQDGPRKLRNQGDIDNRIANIASKQVRGRILALMPKAIVQAGIARCKLTLAGGGDKPISDRINAMVEAFKRFGVTVAHLEEHLGHKVDATTVDELADLTGTFNAIKDGAKASEYFKIAAAESAGNQAAAGAIANAAKKGAEAPAPTPAPTPAPAAVQNTPSTTAPAGRRNRAEQQGNAAKDSGAAKSTNHSSQSSRSDAAGEDAGEKNGSGGTDGSAEDEEDVF